MLAQTVRSGIKNTKNLKLRSKTMKFSNLFQSEPTVESKESKDPEIMQALMKAGLVNIDDEDSFIAEISVPEVVDNGEEPVEDYDEVASYIVENPAEVIVNFPLTPVIELEEKLPFFVSLGKKLENMYSSVEPIAVS